MVPRKIYQKKILKEKHFQYSEDLRGWANNNLHVSQIINISASQSGPDCTWTLWYWDVEYKEIKNPDIKL